MEHPETTFGEDGQLVSVFVGEFFSQAAVDAYLLEQYEDDDQPISPFAADIGLRFYDHDFIESHHEKSLANKEVRAFASHSYGESFSLDVWQAVERLWLKQFDTVFLLYGYAHARYPQAQRQPKLVYFVGTFPYRETLTP